MLNGFEFETAPLSDYELNKIVPLLVRFFRNRYGEKKAVTNHYLCRKMRGYGYVVSEVRIRKAISHIRLCNLVPCLIASSKGYYRVHPDSDRLKEYIDSLKGREMAIRAVREALEEQAV